MGCCKVCCIGTGVLILVIALIMSAIYVSQCVIGLGESVHVHVDSMHLTSHPTDNVLFGWEWLFGKPNDEISITISSGFCKATIEPRDIQENQVITFGENLTINTFFGRGFSFRLQELDSGFEGADDYSQPVYVAPHKLKAMREAFDNDVTDHIQLSYHVTVKGANIFQENKWLGFLAENLCINVLDFIAGPWTGKAFAVGKAVVFKSGDIARLYKAIEVPFKAGTLTKQTVFKSVLAYQLKAGAMAAVKRPLKRKMTEYVKEWVLSKTTLDETVNEIDEQIDDAVTQLKESAIYAVAGEEGVDIYRAIKEEIAEASRFLASLTDSLEFCLSEILPPSKDALYIVDITVSP